MTNAVDLKDCVVPNVLTLKFDFICSSDGLGDQRQLPDENTYELTITGPSHHLGSSLFRVGNFRIAIIDLNHTNACNESCQ